MVSDLVPEEHSLQSDPAYLPRFMRAVTYQQIAAEVLGIPLRYDHDRIGTTRERDLYFVPTLLEQDFVQGAAVHQATDGEGRDIGSVLALDVEG